MLCTTAINTSSTIRTIHAWRDPGPRLNMVPWAHITWGHLKTASRSVPPFCTAHQYRSRVNYRLSCEWWRQSTEMNARTDRCSRKLLRLKKRSHCIFRITPSEIDRFEQFFMHEILKRNSRLILQKWYHFSGVVDIIEVTNVNFFRKMQFSGIWSKVFASLRRWTHLAIVLP